MASIDSISESAPIDIEVLGAQGPRGRDAAATVITGNFTAANDYQYNVTASAVATDPTGVEGKGYTVFVINGTATVGGVAYPTEGTIIRRYYESGTWRSKVYKDSTAYATAAQGTDERVPTAAGLIAKFGTTKVSLVDGDKVAIFDSASADAPKHSLWSSVKSTLKTYFDTVYAAVVHTHTLSSGATDVTMTATNLNTLDDGADSTLHYHSSDRSRANHTGTQLASTISDFASAVASAAPNSVTSATTSDGTADLSLASATVSGLLTAGHIHGNLAGTLYMHVRTGEAMSKGDPFYISGYHVGSSQPIVMRADADDSAKMPAIGVMDADYAANVSSANGIISGMLSNIDTDGYAVNSPIFVADGGGYSNNIGRIPQQIGIAERANANTGAFIVLNVTAHPYFSDVTIATDGALQISNGSGAAYLRAGLTTDVRDFDFPDASGTVLLAEQLTNGSFSANIDSLQVQSSATFEASSVTTFDTGAEVNFLGLNNYENAATFSYGATSATAHRTALGLGTLATQNANAATFSGTTTFNGTSYTYGTGAAAAHREALELTPLKIIASSIVERPVCGFFEDFLGTVNGGTPGANGTFSWSVSGNTGAAAVTEAMPLAYGVIQLTTGSTATNSRSIVLSAGGNTVVGAKNRFCFAIPDVTNCAVWFGGSSNWHLYASSATNSGQWVIRTNGSTITTFTTATPLAGNFSSGKRYQCEICLISTTLIALKLEIADFNSSTWTTIYSGNIAVSAVNNEWGGASPIAAVQTLTNAARTLRLDWASQEHGGIAR